MTRPSLLLAATISLAAGACVIGGFALPALAQQPAAAGSSADPTAIDLDAVPVKPVKGPLSVKGIGGDDEDGVFEEGEASERHDKSVTTSRHQEEEADETAED